CYGADGILGQYIESLYEDKHGNLWVGESRGLWRWAPGPPKLYSMPDSVLGMAEESDGALLIAMLSGIRKFDVKTSDWRLLPEAGHPFPARSILRDRDGGLWIGTTDRGVAHIHRGRTDFFDRSDGLSGNFVERLLEDREGNIWVPTIDGLDRFHDIAVPTTSVKQGLSNATVESVLVSRDRSVWLGTVDGLNRWADGRITVYRSKGGSGLPDDAIESLFQDYQDRLWVATRRGLAFLQNGRFTPVRSVPGTVRAIAGDRSGNVWVSQTDNFFHVRDGNVVEQIPWATLHRKDYARSMATDSAGDVWLGFRGAVVHFAGGEVRASYPVGDGVWSRVKDIRFDSDGVLWAATEGGVSRLKNGRVATLSGKNGLPCDDAHWVMQDDDRSLWVYMVCGLVRVPLEDVAAWAATADKDPHRQVRASVFDSSDGVRTHSSTTGFSPLVAKSSDGKLWFLPWDGVSVVDPRRVPINELPPPVHIEQIIADRKAAVSDANGHMRLPALVREVEIDYTALSLVAEEKVRFRYKLEGHDSDWQDAGPRRQAFYNDLLPRKYRFRVSACNNSGLWNETGASLDFSVDPAYYQTAWFFSMCVAASLALLGALYRLRLRQMARQFDVRLKERLDERTRIAQDLHDTLLQGFLSASMFVKVASDSVPEDSPARSRLDRALQLMRQVIDEGRNAVRGLRSSDSQSLDLEKSLAAVQQECTAHGKDGEEIGFRVIVEGRRRPLHPLLRDEVYRIGREALLNAFRHSGAKHIAVEIKYFSNQLSVIVRDDGCGIDAEVVKSGREGHWGLSGMRERAEKIGARLRLCSSNVTGTEIELSVPGQAAFAGRSQRRWRWNRYSP
ncbi:MAG TPA: two-component regulator propeller domain-containing protein, partial [Candidatus Solibacter sp.]|nr:two-component regulator propeller domain-containing protein [Candidatus Solibacter sp.]